MKRQNALRAMVILALAPAALGAAVSPGFADHDGPGHVICLHVWYESPPGSQPHDVVNECRVGTTWEPTLDDNHCRIFEGDPDVNVCYWWQISTP